MILGLTVAAMLEQLIHAECAPLGLHWSIVNGGKKKSFTTTKTFGGVRSSVSQGTKTHTPLYQRLKTLKTRTCDAGKYSATAGASAPGICTDYRFLDLNNWSRRYGEAPAAAASWRAHDGGRQRRTACPLLYRYHLTHTYCSLVLLPPIHPFLLDAIIL